MRQQNLGILVAMVLFGAAPPSAQSEPPRLSQATQAAHTTTPGSLAVMTYNVKGLPWPIARGRSEPLSAIGERLETLRKQGRQPHVLALQEAFTDEAKEIGRKAGYAHIVNGPSAELVPTQAMNARDRSYASAKQWSKGETQGKYLGSGLQILSDYPIVRVRRGAFPAFACAGYDCLSNKGVLLVSVAAPGIDAPVEILTTHFNSRRSSGVPYERSLYAYQRQVEFMRAFLREHHDPASPIILAGDFNMGKRPERRAVLTANLRRIGSDIRGEDVRDGLLGAIDQSNLRTSQAREAQWIVNRASDRQFVADGAGSSVKATRLSIPFGFESSGEMLSDHMGFTVDYRLGS